MRERAEAPRGGLRAAGSARNEYEYYSLFVFEYSIMACIRIRFVFVGLGIWLYLYLFVSAMVTMATCPPPKVANFQAKQWKKRPKKLIFFQIIFVFANILLIWILSVFESICWPWYLEVFVSVYLWGTGLFAVSVGAKKYSFLALLRSLIDNNVTIIS